MSQAITTLQYPEGIGSIPFASFLHIERFEYQEALKTVAVKQNDALGLLKANEKGLLGQIVTGVNDAIKTAYTDNADKTLENVNRNPFEAYGNLAANLERTGDPFQGPTPLLQDENLKANTSHIFTQVPGERNGLTMEQLTVDKEFRKSLRLKGLSASSCMLPMPNEYQYQYTADWNNKFKLGTLALLAENATKAIGMSFISGFLNIVPDLVANSMAGSNLKGLKNKTSDDLKRDPKAADGGKLFQKAKAGFYRGFDAFKVNSPLGIGNLKNVVSLAGLAPNENAIQMFQSMDMREFEFTFEFAARDAAEATRIESIIEWFKRGMHPTTKTGKGSAVLLQFPDVWVITPKFVEAVQNEKNPDVIEVGSIIQHPSLPKTKLCALTGLQVNTTPMGSFNTVFDGSIPLTQVTVKFKELTALTRMDMELAAQSAGYYDKETNTQVLTTGNQINEKTKELYKPIAGWHRSEELKDFPRLSY